MKRILVILFLITSIPCSAQWISGRFDYAHVIAFGVHDTSFFLSTDALSGDVFRFIPANVPTPNYPWVLSDTGLPGNITSFASLGRYFFAARMGEDSYRSSNNGSTWTLNANAPIASNGTYLYCGGIYLSEDSGGHWQKVTTLAVTSFATIGADVFAVTSNSVWRSEDSGMHWSKISPSVVGPITVMDSQLFITGNGSIVESTDMGTNWSPIAVDSAGVVETVNCLATDGKNLFAGTTNGVLVSADTGHNWRMINNGLIKSLNVTILGVFDTLLFADVVDHDVQNYYLYQRSIPELLDTAKSGVQSLTLSDSIEIYPNPAAGIVTILSGGTLILGVSVLNVLGDAVLDMPNLRESDITVNISKLPSGMYFFLIKTDGESVTRRVVVIK